MQEVLKGWKDVNKKFFRGVAGAPAEGVVEDVNAVILLANLCYVFHEFFKEKLRVAFTAGARGRLPQLTPGNVYRN